MNRPTDHLVTIRLSFDEGEQEEVIFDARIYTRSQEGRIQIAQALAALLLGSAEEVSVSNQGGESRFCENRRGARPMLTQAKEAS